MLDNSTMEAPGSVDEKEDMTTTALLLDAALGDMVAVSTPRTGLDSAGEEGCGGRLRARSLVRSMISTCGGRLTRTMSRRR
jgi:hypothetical protein